MHAQTLTPGRLGLGGVPAAGGAKTPSSTAVVVTPSPVMPVSRRIGPPHGMHCTAPASARAHSRVREPRRMHAEKRTPTEFPARGGTAQRALGRAALRRAELQARHVSTGSVRESRVRHQTMSVTVFKCLRQCSGQWQQALCDAFMRRLVQEPEPAEGCGTKQCAVTIAISAWVNTEVEAD